MQQPATFLPPGFDFRRPVALIAGQGLYPARTLAGLRAAGVPVRLIAFEGETTAEMVASFPPQHRRTVRVGQLGAMLRALRELGVAAALMVGQITPRRLFRGLHPDWRTFRLLTRLKTHNAHTIFGAICAEIEKLGVQVLDARCFVESDLATPDVSTGVPWRLTEEEVRFGIDLARECAALEIGQGVVVRRGTVVAVEAFEGTDAMLTRAGAYKTKGLLFVKCAKPGHDFRFDVPVFGLKTVAVMAAGHIRHAALQAGSTLLLDRAAVLAAAAAAGLSLRAW